MSIVALVNKKPRMGVRFGNSARTACLNDYSHMLGCRSWLLSRQDDGVPLDAGIYRESFRTYRSTAPSRGVGLPRRFRFSALIQTSNPVRSNLTMLPGTCDRGTRMTRLSPVLLLLILPSRLPAAEYPEPTSADHVIRDFRFASGETLPELRVHYRTIGTPRRRDDGRVDNAVLILHGTTGSGASFLRPEFAGELFGVGQPLDASRFYLILADGIGHGGSSKPSDGLHGRFPRYGYRDMIEAQYRLVTEGLKVDHLRLVIGTSMGGMHTWLWGEMHPEFADALMPLASLPTQISGRNRAWRRLISDAIRNDPSWENGDYRKQPPSLKTAAEMLFLMSNNPVERQKEAPTRADADRVIDTYVARTIQTMDANDVLYAIESSTDYDPGPELGRIVVPLLAINFEDDLINPPELNILEQNIRLVKRGKAILIPRSDRTRGHGTHTLAAVWKEHLKKLLSETNP